jgi:hypothetical protein
MKWFGLVPHRSFLNDNNFTLEDGTEIDNNNFRKYERTHNMKDKTKLNKIHLVYCIFLLISKIIFVSINGIYLTIPEKHFSDTNISSSFVSVLFFLVNSLMFLIMTSFPIYSLILHLTQKGFYESILSFEYFERQMQNYIQSNLLQNEFSSKSLSIDKKLKKFKVIFIFSCFVLIGMNVGVNVFMIVEVPPNNSPETLILSLVLTFFTWLCILDFCMIIYFISKNILIINFQADDFYRVLSFIIKNSERHDNESIRDLYNCLNKHVQIADQWIRYFYGVTYTTFIPAVCLYPYTAFLGNSKVKLGTLVDLTILIIILVFITIIAILLNFKVLNQYTVRSKSVLRHFWLKTLS